MNRSEKDLQFIQLDRAHFEELKKLQQAFKAEIGENIPSDKEINRLFDAILNGKIQFYGCLVRQQLIATCSVSKTFSTFNYKVGGVFDDFYIKPEYRHKGIARALAAYAYKESDIYSLSVGCADCDIKMYQSIGFKIPLGNMLAYED